MIKALFGEVKTGRLMRLQYLGYSVLLSLLMFGFGLAVVMAIGVGENIAGGDLQQAQDQLREQLTLPVILVMAVVMPLFLFIGVNIMAKRIRDIGLPGWWTVLAIFIVSGVVSYLVSDNAGSIVNTLAWVALVLVPGNALAKGTAD
jgi:uncharacterized membrane protein YhaH (DUF805 family)